ncbi:MAG: sigma-70 family RNA polymerase sigma factor [Pseudolysinimonas sp.]
MSDITEALSKLAREESGRVLALLAARFSSVDLADDCVQDALVQAVETWSDQGIPANPASWLYTVAHNRIIDRLRRDATARRRLQAAAPELTTMAFDNAAEQEEVPIVEAREVGDEQLRLMLLCCHPALDRDTQIALTLRLVGGLTTPEIAAAFLVAEATLAQRIVRAKRKIRDARIPLSIPAELDERVDALLTVLYLVFNEGYLARGGSPDAVRVSLADEALRLTGLAIELLPGPSPARAEAEALLALELYHRSRLETRLDGAGDIVLLADQDRSRWNGALIAQANGILKRVLGTGPAGQYQLQALIASQHANAVTSADTDWITIAALYEQLMRVAGSPVVALNHAVAVSMADGPRAGLALLDELATPLENYHLYWASRGELLARTASRDLAREAFTRARALTANPAEQRHLDRRIAGV